MEKEHSSLVWFWKGTRAWMVYTVALPLRRRPFKISLTSFNVIIIVLDESFALKIATTEENVTKMHYHVLAER